MIFSRRLGAFLPFGSFVTSIVATLCLKPYIDKEYPNSAVIAYIVAALLLFAAICIVLYLVNLLLVDRFGSNEVDSRLKRRWRERLSTRLEGKPQNQQIEDYIDRVADLHMRFCKPDVVEGIILDSIQSERDARLAAENANAQLLAKNHFCGFVKLMADHWRSSVTVLPRERRLVDDPVHGCVALDEPLATLLAHPLLQRLNRVRQLSFSYSQFPSSTHSRLSHCLGVVRNVERALTVIFDRGVYYEVGKTAPLPLPPSVLGDRSRIIQKAKVAALLHDLGHGPFGHALDNYIAFSNITRTNPDPDKYFTGRYIVAYLAPTLSKLGFDPQEIVTILDPTERYRLTGTDTLIGELIDSSLDVDRMDYLIRDAHMTGLSMGFTNSDALLDSLRPVLVDDAYTLAFDVTAISYMEHFLYAREAMYRNCYEHPRKRAAERIFERLVREIAKDDTWKTSDEDVYALADEEILCALRLSGLKPGIRSELLKELLGDLNYCVVHDVWIRGDPDSAAGLWAAGATKGKTGDLKLRYIEQPVQWEESIAAASIGIDRVAQIQVIVPAPSAYKQKKFSAARILIRRDGEFQTEEFFEIAKHTEKMLEEMNPTRARIKVMCPASWTDAEKESVRQAATKELGR